MDLFLPLFLVLFASVFASLFFTRLHLPWVVALILGGVIVGPHALDIFTPDQTISFIGELGLLFLMFMAGLGTRLSSFREQGGGGIIAIAIINGGVPFLAGFGIGVAFGFDLTAAILLGIIFISSSIAVVIPTLASLGILEHRLGRSITAATILEDVASLVLLTFVLQTVAPTTALPLPLFFVFLFGALMFTRWLLPKIRWLLQLGARNTDVLFQQELRSVFVILIGTVVVFDLLGLHPIIAGFFAGMVLSDSLQNEAFKEKIKTIAYGIFIPIFFVVVGSQTDISVFLDADESAFLLVAAIVLGSVISKFGSGFVAARLVGFTKNEALVTASATIPQLSTTLAVVYTGVALGILDDQLVTAMVVLSIVTVLLSPLLVWRFAAQHFSTEEPLSLLNKSEETPTVVSPEGETNATPQEGGATGALSATPSDARTPSKNPSAQSPQPHDDTRTQ